MKANIKRDNKGFSLIELIIVVAIMAVLTAVIAPQFLKYVDKARRQKDVSSAYEMVNVLKVLQADIVGNAYEDFTVESNQGISFNKKLIVENLGSEENFMEQIRNLKKGEKKVFYADFFDMLGGIPESSLGENYVWYIALEPNTGTVKIIALSNSDNPDDSYILYPEHEQFLKGIGVTFAELMDMFSAIYPESS